MVRMVLEAQVPASDEQRNHLLVALAELVAQAQTLPEVTVWVDDGPGSSTLASRPLTSP